MAIYLLLTNLCCFMFFPQAQRLNKNPRSNWPKSENFHPKSTRSTNRCAKLVELSPPSLVSAKLWLWATPLDPWWPTCAVLSLDFGHFWHKKTHWKQFCPSFCWHFAFQRKADFSLHHWNRQTLSHSRHLWFFPNAHVFLSSVYVLSRKSASVFSTHAFLSWIS